MPPRRQSRGCSLVTRDPDAAGRSGPFFFFFLLFLFFFFFFSLSLFFFFWVFCLLVCFPPPWGRGFSHVRGPGPVCRTGNSDWPVPSMETRSSTLLTAPVVHDAGLLGARRAAGEAYALGDREPGPGPVAVFTPSKPDPASPTSKGPPL